MAPQTAAAVVVELNVAAWVVEATLKPVLPACPATRFPAAQWFRNGTLIANATNTTYTIAATALTDNSAGFTLRATNLANGLAYSVTSGGTLTVTADTNPPVDWRANVGIVASSSRAPERIRLTTATNRAVVTGQPMARRQHSQCRAGCIAEQCGPDRDRARRRRVLHDPSE